uniref:7TM_GPCR_Srx domain-containing protein n=1 Tax=Heterorhabditis bacteriophora TaxID=37862 RepID=A0A1I7W6P9_HETBA
MQSCAILDRGCYNELREVINNAHDILVTFFLRSKYSLSKIVFVMTGINFSLFAGLLRFLWQGTHDLTRLNSSFFILGQKYFLDILLSVFSYYGMLEKWVL